MLTPADLVWLRAAADLHDSCVIVRAPDPASVPDGEGGWLPGVPTRLGPLPCTYYPAGGTEGRRGAGTQIAAINPAAVVFAAETDVRGPDQLEVTLWTTGAVLRLEVSNVQTRGDEFVRTVQVEELHPT